MKCNEKPCPDCSVPKRLRERWQCELCSKTGKVHDVRNVMFELPLPKHEKFRFHLVAALGQQVRRAVDDVAWGTHVGASNVGT